MVKKTLPRSGRDKPRTCLTKLRLLPLLLCLGCWQTVNAAEVQNISDPNKPWRGFVGIFNNTEQQLTYRITLDRAGKSIAYGAKKSVQHKNANYTTFEIRATHPTKRGHLIIEMDGKTVCNITYIYKTTDEQAVYKPVHVDNRRNDITCDIKQFPIVTVNDTYR